MPLQRDSVDLNTYAKQAARGRTLEQMRDKWVQKMPTATPKPTTPATERGRALVKAIKAEPAPKPRQPQRRYKRVEPFQALREAIYVNFQQYEKEQKTKNPFFAIQWPHEFATITRLLSAYFGHWSSEDDPFAEYLPDYLPTHKGIFLHGTPGNGKTTLFRIMKRFCDQVNQKKFEINDFKRVILDLADSAQNFKTYASKDRLFDDFLRASSKVQNRARIDAANYLIYDRYERFQRYGQTTHFTCNLPKDEIAARLDDAAFDKLLEMCTFLEVGGSSFRA